MKKYIEPLIHGLIWITGFILVILWVNTIGPFRKADGTLLYPVIFGTVINVILFYLNAFVLIPQYSKDRKTVRFIISILLLLILITSFETIVDNLFFVVYHSSEKELFSTQYLTNLFLNIVVLILSLGYGLTRTWIKKEKSNQHLKEEKLSAELDFLKAQLNPHFLFNVLNMAFSSATSSGDERTADMIEKLAGLMRYMLYESNVDKIELSKEIAYIENYINLQKLRLSDDLPVSISFKTKGNCNKNKIAPLILIPFIENAFKYGIKLGEKSKIDIDLYIKDDNLQFTVENTIFNTQGNLEDKNSGLGLKNVIKRLSILYPNNHKLELVSADKYFVNLIMNLKS
ncbi:MAG: sensor histidine kinase [bacterium]